MSHGELGKSLAFGLPNCPSDLVVEYAESEDEQTRATAGRHPALPIEWAREYLHEHKRLIQPAKAQAQPRWARLAAPLPMASPEPPAPDNEEIPLLEARPSDVRSGDIDGVL